MATNTEWFQALGIEEAKEEQAIVRLWVWVLFLAALLCMVAYATNP